MISHKHKCIFIHIPKTAGMSINAFFHPEVEFHYAKPDYERLFGWCPKRKIHMQHATAKQLLETELISDEDWKNYYKFSFVRNPWDRAYSDFMWIQNFANITGDFSDYLLRSGPFEKIFNDNSDYHYLGDHLYTQSSFLEVSDGYDPIDFVGRFENFQNHITQVLNHLKIKEPFTIRANVGRRCKDYSLFYSNSNLRTVKKRYSIDIKRFNYQFEDNRDSLTKIKRFLWF